MDFIFEFLIGLLIEGGIKISSNKKINKLIRYPVLILMVMFFSVIIVGIIILGILLLKKNILFAILLLCIGLFMLIGSIVKLRRIYLREKRKDK